MEFQTTDSEISELNCLRIVFALDRRMSRTRRLNKRWRWRNSVSADRERNRGSEHQLLIIELDKSHTALDYCSMPCIRNWCIWAGSNLSKLLFSVDHRLVFISLLMNGAGGEIHSCSGEWVLVALLLILLGICSERYFPQLAATWCLHTRQLTVFSSHPNTMLPDVP